MKQLRELGRLLAGLLRELADENAYRRHLERQGCPHSPGEWRRFSEARMRAKYSRAKCC
jgi:transposase